MKIIMTSLETKEIVLIVEGPTLTSCCAAAILKHTMDFGEDYLYELLAGLADLATGEGDAEYLRKDFSDPEANFKLELKY